MDGKGSTVVKMLVEMARAEDVTDVNIAAGSAVRRIRLEALGLILLLALEEVLL